MTQTGVDNSHLAMKVALRARHLPAGNVSVLDCFAGDGVIWQKLSAMYPGRVMVDSIEMARGKGAPSFVGDNRKLLPALDLSVYNVIDLDAYGSPWDQVAAIMENPTRRPRATVFYTMIHSLFAGVPSLLRRGNDFTPAMTKVGCKVMADKWVWRAWCNALARYGVRELVDIRIPRRGMHEKRYGVFRIPEVV